MCKCLARLVATIAAVGVLLTAAPASADRYRYDFAFEKYWTNPAYTSLPANEMEAKINSAWRSLMSEMGAILAPNFLSPAETSGWHGFVLGFKYGFTSLNDTADYWKYGVDGNPDPVASTISLEVRKGIWMPLPSFELGGGFTHLVDSHMFTVNIFAKFAIHEGFHHWPTPALAVRGYFQRLVGAHQVDFTNLSLDISLSKSFGIAGSFNLTPYAGYNIFWVIAKSEVIDSTPGTDALQCSDGRCDNAGDPYGSPLPPGAYCNTTVEGDCNAYYVLLDQDAILRHRLFFGIRFNFTVTSKLRLTLTTEYATTISGVSDDSYTINNVNFKLKDKAALQHTWSFLVGIDY
jgi:hypothetical protein